MSEIGFIGMAISVLLSTFRVSVPLVFTAMGGIMSERSGVVNIALEGLMLMGAFTAAAVAHSTHSPWLGALAGIGGGVLLAVIYGVFVIQFRADQIVAGTAINLLAFGLTPLLSKAFFDSTGATPSLEMTDRFGNEPLYFAAIVVIGIYFWFKHSRLGLWVSFAGEHPEALSTAGIRVRAVRWYGVLMAGALAGMGGATLSIFLSSSFTRGMTAGRGFMALAALIFGKWKPIPTLFACLFFGLMDALQIRLQGVPVFGDDPIPVQFIQILPYVFTVLVLAGFMGKSRPPKALGAPWLGMFLLMGFFLTSGCEFKLPGQESAVARAPSPTVNTSALRSPEARLSKENGELLVEMIRVVFLRDPKDPNSFSAYHSSLNQGASLEGILNGLTHSAGYREFEKESKPAEKLARAFFVDELVRIQSGAREPFLLNERSGLPLQKFDFPTGSVSEITYGKSKPVLAEKLALKFDEKTARENYSQWFESSSLPTLKRVLIEVLLSRFEGETVELGKWYSETAARLAGAGVDFGIAQRNTADVKFHRDWYDAVLQRLPLSQARDRVLWELLNRELRILNQLNAGHP